MLSGFQEIISFHARYLEDWNEVLEFLTLI